MARKKATEKMREVAVVYLEDFTTGWSVDAAGRMTTALRSKPLSLSVKTARGSHFAIGMTDKEIRRLTRAVRDPLLWRACQLRVSLYVPAKVAKRMRKPKEDDDE